MSTRLRKPDLGVTPGGLKSLTSLWSITAEELAVRCCTSAAADITYVRGRVKHEGLSFLAITLADYGKTIERWLDRGFVVPSDASSFRTGSRLTGLPTFLSGFLGRVFDPTSGVLLDNPDIEAIYAVRQLTLNYGKIALPVPPIKGGTNQRGNRRVVTKEREEQAMSDYVKCEHDVREAAKRLFPHDREEFKRISALLYGDLFTKMNREVQNGRLTGKHGPGTTADRLLGNKKWTLRSWPARLQRDFPAEEFLVLNSKPERVLELHRELTFVEPDAEVPVKVTAVPKTLKTPRIIAMEPTAMQLAQQALFNGFRDCLKEDSFLSAIIGIEDQDPNREMALEGSRSGNLATLDLSEASDRVASLHVSDLLEDYPELHRAVFSCRSTKANVRGFGVLPLSKFASMGSALCFPMEAMVFMTIIFMGIQKELNTPLTERIVRSYLGRVRVFGDDIIIPVDMVHTVVHELENFGLRVNVAKSFWIGRFRESCGREYYDGHDVSIVRVRQVLPTSRLDAEGVISTVEYRNLAYWAGLWKTAAWLDRWLKALLIEYPTVGPDSPLLGRESALGYGFRTLDSETHSPIAKGYYVRARPPIDHLDGEGALYKCLIGNPGNPMVSKPWVKPKMHQFDVASVDDEHLERSGRPEHVSIKLGWRPPY